MFSGRWRARLAAALVVSSLLATACGGSDSDDEADAGASTPSSVDAQSGGERPEGPGTPEPKPLAERTSVTISPVVAVEPFAPAYLAQAMGEFERENLDVSIKELSPPDVFVLLARGDTQLVMAGASGAFMNAVNAGTDLVWTANIHNQAEGQDGLWLRNDVLDDEGHVLPEKLDDRLRIGLGAGGLASTSILPVQHWIESEGGSLADVDGVAIPTTADMLVAVEQGSLDGVYATTPISLEIAAGDCCTLVTPQPPFAASMYTMTASFQEEQPEVARAIMRALLRTVRTYLQGDYHADDEVMTALADAMGTDAETLRAQPSLLFDPDMGMDTQSIEALQEAWIEVGLLEYQEPLPPDRLVDTSLVDEILSGQ